MSEVHKTVYDKFLESNDKNRVVTHVTITATAAKKGGVCHWRFYLQLLTGLPNDSQAVVLDMSPVLPPLGTLLISSKEAAKSTSAHKLELVIPTIMEPTVGQFIDLFLQKGMDRYKFNEKGAGCYYWVSKGVQMLEEVRFVETGASEKLDVFYVEQAEIHLHEDLCGSVGEFY